jgi:hypothetical protein
MTPFDTLLAEAMAGADRFGHREHVHVTWLAVRSFGATAAVTIISDGIQLTARYAGAPQKYHATISRAWVELVACHALPTDPDFTTFAERNPALLDKRLLRHFYRPATLASAAARTGWVPPDLAPIPHSTSSSFNRASSHDAPFSHDASDQPHPGSGAA